MQSEKLGLKMLYQNQAQKEIIINQNFNILDKVTNTYVISKTAAVPPLIANFNELYIVADDAKEEWLGKEQQITYFEDGWKFIKPREGMIYFILDENEFSIYRGGNWLNIRKHENI